MESGYRVPIEMFDLDIFENDDTPSTRRFAWADIHIMSCKQESGFITENKISRLEYGELLVSVDELARRWKWDNNRVLEFLTTLENDKMIYTKAIGSFIFIRILNYEYCRCEDSRGFLKKDMEVKG